MGVRLIRLLANESESEIGSAVIVNLSQDRDENIVLLQALTGDFPPLTSSSRGKFLFRN